MLHSNGQYPDFPLTALFLRLAIALACSQLLAVPKSPYRGTRYLNLVTPHLWGSMRNLGRTKTARLYYFWPDCL
jgi:hypothetical protein